MPSILVADDNANIQKMVALAFEERGIKVVAVGNGEAAVRRIPEVQPDLVLADVFMPVRNGYEVCEFVKKDERFAHVPVVLLVGAFDPLDEKEARRVGADGVLKKPFIPPDPLIAMVTSALEKNPKVVAELAAAKAAPVERVPVPAPEVLAKPAPKPLPEFPEPTGDDAAVAYGYGARTSVFVGEPQDAPESPEEAAQADEDVSEEAPESNDWRHSAMNFEVPQDVANQVPFAPGGNFDAAMFPSEQDVRPTKVRAPDAVPEFVPPAAEQASSPAEAATKTSLPELFPSPIEEAAVSVPAAKQPEPPPSAPTGPAPVPVISVPEPESSVAAEHVVERGKEAPVQSGYSVAAPVPTEQAEQSASEPSSKPASSSKGSNWIFEADAGAPLPAKTTAPEAPNAAVQATQEESFFADEPVDKMADEPAPSPQEAVHPALPQPVSSTHASVAPEFEPEPEDAQPPLAFKDPNLEEPAAVKVIPDELLVEDAPQTPSHYGGAEEIPPTYSYVTSRPASAIPEEPAKVAPALESSSNEFGLPAGASPLSPAPEESEPIAVDSQTVDAVVQKVLEKLEPQLHEILAAGVLRPLVQNLLQNELVHKSK